MDEDLSELYYNLENSSAYAGLDRLYKAVRAKGMPYSKADVRYWLNAQPVYTLHKPVRKKFPRSRVISWGPNWLLEADMALLPEYVWRTSNKPWLLVCICTFSKYLWVRALKSKKGAEVAAALKEIFAESKPVYFRTDYGAEFFNKEVAEVLKQFDVHHYGAGNVVKAAHAERVIRTLKNKIYRHFTKNPKRGRFEDELREIVDGYNKTKHSAHGHRPVDVGLENQHKIFVKLYPDYCSKRFRRDQRPIFKKGDRVRLSKFRTPFQKGYRQNYTREIFEITDVNLTRSPPTYKIKSGEDDRAISGSMYADEMARVEELSSSRKV